MTDAQIHSRLLNLPWELRRPIIVHVLPFSRKTQPRFNEKLITKRIRLRNCFDKRFAEETNLYVPKHKVARFLHGNGLRNTNSQLRYETNLVIEEEVKSGNLDEIPFILDIMIVKDIGIFPTWMSFPYQPEHIKKLTINMRIIRPGMATIPDEWIEAARYPDLHRDKAFVCHTSWNTIMAVVLYAFGCFTVKPDASRSSNHPRYSQLASTEEAEAETAPDTDTDTDITEEQVPTTTTIIENKEAIASTSTQQQQQTTTTTTTTSNSNTKNKNIPLPAWLKAKIARAIKPNLTDHRSDVVNAYVRSSASYVTDELVLNIGEFELDVNNKPIPPGVDDSLKNSRFYKERFVQFGRELFEDFSWKWKDRDQIKEERDFISQGKYACYQLEDTLSEMFSGIGTRDSNKSIYGPYYRLLSYSVGELRYSGCLRHSYLLVERYPWAWTDHWFILDGHDKTKRFSDANLEWNLAEELASKSPNKQAILSIRTVQIRKSHGWVRDDGR